MRRYLLVLDMDLLALDEELGLSLRRPDALGEVHTRFHAVMETAEH